MKTNEINICDPYVLVHGGKYYLYGTRSESCWSEMDGFDCYVGDDLENWEGPIEIFHRPESFFATQNFWAPECYHYNDAFYFVTTFGGTDFKKGIYVLKAEQPEGPYSLYSQRLTPEDWVSIDGTLHFENDRVYLVFSHSFEDRLEANITMVELAADLSHAMSEPKILFLAREAAWARPFPWAKEEFGIEGDCYFTDGPSLRRMPDGTLYMLWSSWGTNGYAVGVARSVSDTIQGPWQQSPQAVWPENGGHGMIFEDLNGQLLLTLHYPNDKFAERPTFHRLMETKDKTLILSPE